MFSNFPRIGGRVWKTGVAVIITLAVCRALGINESVFAAIIALISVQPTVVSTFRYGWQQLLATVLSLSFAISLMVGLTYVDFPYARPVAIGIGIIFIMWLCLLFRWYDTMGLAAITVLVMLVYPASNDVEVIRYAEDRAIATAVGILVATGVNAFVWWPKMEDRFPKRLHHIASQAFSEFENAVNIYLESDIEAARKSIRDWDNRKKPFELAANEIRVLNESATVRRRLLFARPELTPVISYIYSIIDAIHISAYNLLRDVESALSDFPDNHFQDSRIHHLISRILESSTRLHKAIITSLKTGDNTALRDVDFDWTRKYDAEFESFIQFAVAMRSAESREKGTYQLFETASVFVELRDYIRSLALLRDVLLENETLLAKLRPRRKYKIGKQIK